MNLAITVGRLRCRGFVLLPGGGRISGLLLVISLYQTKASSGLSTADEEDGGRGSRPLVRSAEHPSRLLKILHDFYCTASPLTSACRVWFDRKLSWIGRLFNMHPRFLSCSGADPRWGLGSLWLLWNPSPMGRLLWTARGSGFIHWWLHCWKISSHIGASGCQSQGKRSQVEEVKVPSLPEALWRNANKWNLRPWNHDLV